MASTKTKKTIPHTNSAATNPNPAPESSLPGRRVGRNPTPGTPRKVGPASGGAGYGGPTSGRPVKGVGSKGKGKGATYGVGLGGTPPSNRGGTQIAKAANSKTSGGQVTRKTAKKAYKGKNFTEAWQGYKRRGSRRRLPNKTAGKPMR